MKIVFSTDQIYLHGGIEKVMAEKANYFADILHYEVVILTTEQQGKRPCYQLSERVICYDLAINYNRKLSYFHWRNLLKVPKHYRAWKRVIGAIGPDVLISCNYAFDFFWLPFSQKKVIKFKEYHSSRYFEWHKRQKASILQRLRFSIDDYVASKYHKLLLLNPSEAKFFKSTNTAILPNAISWPDRNSHLNNKRAVAAGRIAPVKGFDTLIHIWEKVVADLPDWRLFIYGQGEPAYINYLQKLIKDKNLTEFITIAGATTNLQEELLQASLYLLTSKTECYPMVLLESLSAGVPVVAFDCPTGPTHIVQHQKTGLLIPDQDIDKFAKEVVLLAGNVALLKQMGEQARADATRFTNELVMRQWQSLFTHYRV